MRSWRKEISFCKLEQEALQLKYPTVFCCFSLRPVLEAGRHSNVWVHHYQGSCFLICFKISLRTYCDDDADSVLQCWYVDVLILQHFRASQLATIKNIMLLEQSFEIIAFNPDQVADSIFTSIKAFPRLKTLPKLKALPRLNGVQAKWRACDSATKMQQ